MLLVLLLLLASCSAWQIKKGRAEAADWLSRVDSELQRLNAGAARATWRLAVAPDTAAARWAAALGEQRARWRRLRCAEAASLDLEVLEADQRRQVVLLCRGPSFTPHQTRELLAVSGELQALYESTRVCDQGHCLRGEPDLERVMSGSQDPDTLLWAWSSWRDAVGPPARPLFSRLVRLQNLGASNNGYSDIGECWREELETPQLSSVVEALYARVEDLYRLLHAVVRRRLRSVHGAAVVSDTGPIPAHLLGNMWAQSWDPLLPLLYDNEGGGVDVTAALRSRNFTVADMARSAEDFYTSLGLEPMTSKFWKHSRLEAPRGGREDNYTCHGTAANMFSQDDFRMLLCAEVTKEDFYVIHHEMGHIEYYMSYRKQPTLFQEGATSAFQEAVGDSIMYGVMAPQHLQRLGLLSDSQYNAGTDAQLLLQQGLSKIPQLPFGLVVDKWRWNVFNGNISPRHYNGEWWKLRTKYQGIAPPVPRSENDFDPASKFHIADNTPYIRYFLSGILQMQMFKGLCERTVFGEARSKVLPMPLHQCDIYGSKEAGKKLGEMMQLGSSKPWQQALHILTGTYNYDVEPLLQYYAPLKSWLLEQIDRYDIPVGWE